MCCEDNSNNDRIKFVATCVLSVLVVLIFSITWYNYKALELYTNKGYSPQAIKGCSTPCWTLSDPNSNN